MWCIECYHAASHKFRWISSMRDAKETYLCALTQQSTRGYHIWHKNMDITLIHKPHISEIVWLQKFEILRNQLRYWQSTWSSFFGHDRALSEICKAIESISNDSLTCIPTFICVQDTTNIIYRFVWYSWYHHTQSQCKWYKKFRIVCGRCVQEKLEGRYIALNPICLNLECSIDVIWSL